MPSFTSIFASVVELSMIASVIMTPLVSKSTKGVSFVQTNDKGLVVSLESVPDIHPFMFLTVLNRVRLTDFYFWFIHKGESFIFYQASGELTSGRYEISYAIDLCLD